MVLSIGIIGCSSIISAFQTPISNSISPFRTQTKITTTQLFSTREKPTQTKSKPKTTLVDPSNLHVNGDNNGASSPTTISDDLILLDLSSYENSLLSSWDDPRTQKGFDWEIEKLRRYFAGLRQVEDGTWVRKPSLFDFLVTHTPSNVVGVSGSDSDRYEAPPQPVNMVDVVVLVIKNLLNGIGFGPSLGMAAVPDAIIQKYEGSFFSFIKGVLGGDLQTLAGGPLFLLLEKYYNVHGPIFNLSFGPKSFLIISDPVMARHILRDSSPEQYCKGILAEILEPIMGDGLIPADPKIWKVSL